MRKTMQLQQSVLQNVVSMLDDHEAMVKLNRYINRIKNERKAAEELSPAEKEEILDDIREGLREIKAAEDGKVELQTARDFLHELRS